MKSEIIPVLLLASESGEGQFLHLMSPELKKQLEAEGFSFTESFASQLEPSDLDAFAVIVLLRSPLPGHPKDDTALFKSLESDLAAFVEKGGGLVMMFCECYGKTVSSLNRLAARFDIQFAFNDLSDSLSEHCSSLPNMPEGRLINAFAESNALFKPRGGSLYLVVDGGHGTQALTCLPSDDWNVLLRGSDTCCSKPYPNGYYTACSPAPIISPVLSACRTFGRGRVCAFPGSSAIWLANASLPRWKNFLMQQNDWAGRNFLASILRWSAGPSPIGDPAAAALLSTRRIVKQEDFSYRYLTDDETAERIDLKPHKIWIGIPPATDSIMNVASIAASEGYTAAVVLADFDNLTQKQWERMQTTCRAASDTHGITMQPGFEMLDDEGNTCVVFNVDALPEMRRAYPNSNMLEDLLVKLSSYSAVFACPAQNRIPAWRHGGYNLMEIDNNHDTIDIYRERITSCYSIAPVTICRNALPGKESIITYTLASSPETAIEAICGNRRDSFVTQGPVLDAFRWQGDAVMLDDWEGIWMEWNDGDNLSVKLALHSERPLTNITLYDSNTVFRNFNPGTTNFETVISFPATRDMRLHLTAEDANGQTLIASPALYSRCRTFWAHVGSDQMNDYHNLWHETDTGGTGIGDRFYEAFGFVTLGFAWGDYIRMASTLPWSDVMPLGMEVSVLVCSFKSFHPSPFIQLSGKSDFLNNHHRVLGECTSNSHNAHSFSDGSWLEQPGAVWQPPGSSRTFHPTRAITPSKLWQATADYVIPAWQPHETCSVKVDMQIRFLADVTIEPGQGFSIGHSLHVRRPGIRLGLNSEKGRAPDSFLSFSEPVMTNEENKEWDNADMVRRMAQPLTGNELEIPRGSAGGTRSEPLGCFLLENRFMPGTLFMRGWERGSEAFALSFELVPYKRELKAGSVLNLEYTLYTVIEDKL